MNFRKNSFFTVLRPSSNCQQRISKYSVFRPFAFNWQSSGHLFRPGRIERTSLAIVRMRELVKLRATANSHQKNFYVSVSDREVTVLNSVFNAIKQFILQKKLSAPLVEYITNFACGVTPVTIC